MTKANITVGTTVYVHWYGKLLQGTVVNNHDLMGMVAVRIPLMGGHPVALFTPSHVYDQPPLSDGKPQQQTVTPPDVIHQVNHSEAWQAIQLFKQEHWDTSRNRLRIDALEDFYHRWRTAVAAKYGINIDSTVLSGFPAESATIAVDPAAPDGDHSAIITVDTATGAIVGCAAAQPQPLIKNIDQVAPPLKLTKKQLRSTGRIQYTDSVQTSIFD